MSGESVTLRAIRWARTALAAALDDAEALAYMADRDTSPSDVEDVIAEILEYLEKTKDEEGPHA